MNQEDTDPLINLAQIYQKLDNKTQAIECYEKVININPQDFEAYNCKGIGYF